MMFRVMFNTAFIQNGNYICAGRMHVSPEDVRKSNILQDDFLVYIFFEDDCSKCSPYATEIKDLCEKCKKNIGPDIINQWNQVKSITDAHIYPTIEQGHQLLHSVDPQRYELLLKTELQFNPDYYRIVNLEDQSDDKYGIDAMNSSSPVRKET